VFYATCMSDSNEETMYLQKAIWQKTMPCCFGITLPSYYFHEFNPFNASNTTPSQNIEKGSPRAYAGEKLSSYNIDMKFKYTIFSSNVAAKISAVADNFEMEILTGFYRPGSNSSQLCP
jgi:hypothetical protein